MDTPLPNSSSNTSGGDGGDRSDSAGFGGSANSTQNAFGSPARGSDKNAHHGAISPAPGQAVEFITYHYHVRLFKILCEVTDAVAQTRFFAEFAMLLLHRTVHEDEAVELTMNASEEWDRFSASRSGYKFAVTLPSAVLRSHPVRLLLECGTRTAANAVLGRFVTALCDSYHALLQYTLTPLLVLWPAVHQRAQVGMGAGSTSSRGGGSKGSAAQADFMDFAPTVAATSTGGGGGEGGGYEKKITCDPLLLPVLQAHLDGTQELLHPWSLVHDPLCTGRIKQACSAIHTLLMLHPVSAAAATAGGEKNENNATGVAEGEVVAKLLDPKELAVRVRAEFDKLVAILVRLLEGSVFAIKTFEQ